MFFIFLLGLGIARGFWGFLVFLGIAWGFLGIAVGEWTQKSQRLLTFGFFACFFYWDW